MEELRIRRQNRIYSRKTVSDRGATLIEMIVCFALLSIFVTAAASIIASTTNLYYQVKGETYSAQVADILMEKISSEIEGAKYSESGVGNPVISPGTSSEGSYVDLYDRTDTHVKIGQESGYLYIYYYEIRNNDAQVRKETVWRFSENIYNTYKITDLKFLPAEDINIGAYNDIISEYGLSASNLNYPKNVVLVLMEIKSERYGAFKTYNVPEE